ncbi:MAG: universal stress protein [Verrucomicrobia bacterium]|jgi:nucleotide-binding universal stress UspA family protein|nr:universal stress protein [Verrucomicrobiota bacterium]
MRAILAAVDFSGVSESVVTQAARLARAVGGKVVLVTVLVEPVFLQEDGAPSQRVGELTVAHEREVRRRLAEWQERLQATGVMVETAVRKGVPAPHLLQEAEEHDARWIVIGSHGHNALFELIVGSTTQSVLKRARLPVMVVPATRE